MNKLISYPGFSHIATKILSILQDKDQLSCRLGEYGLVLISFSFDNFQEKHQYFCSLSIVEDTCGPTNLLDSKVG